MATNPNFCQEFPLNKWPEGEGYNNPKYFGADTLNTQKRVGLAYTPPSALQALVDAQKDLVKKSESLVKARPEWDAHCIEFNKLQDQIDAYVCTPEDEIDILKKVEHVEALCEKHDGKRKRDEDARIQERLQKRQKWATDAVPSLDRLIKTVEPTTLKVLVLRGLWAQKTGHGLFMHNRGLDELFGEPERSNNDLKKDLEILFSMPSDVSVGMMVETFKNVKN